MDIFATTLGCSHISVCMAGATNTGALVANNVVPSKSGAKPAAMEARVCAVAGATITRSAFCPKATWRTSATASKRLVGTALREIASHVGTPTNFNAEAVGMTVTVAPRRTSSRTKDTAL